MQKEFTAQAEKVLIAAKNLARKWNHPYIGTEHLLLALKKEFTGVASQVLGMNGVEEEKIVKIIEELVAPVQDIKRKRIAFSPRLEFLLDNAMQEAVRQNSEKVGTEHMLLAMIKDADCVATRILGFVNAPTLQQKMVVKCLNEQTDISYYDRNRETLYNGLTECGFTCIKPEGAFYLFVKSPVEDEKEFCEAAKKYNILIVPGSSFGCPGYVRMAYCVAYETIVNALPKFKELAKEYF